jgi:putative MFS transporter
MRWGLIGRFLGLMMMATALSYSWLVAGLFIAGFFIGFNRPAVCSFAIEILPVKGRAAIMIGLFVFVLSGALGSATLTIYLLPMEKEDGWRTVLLICVLPVILGLIGAYMLFIEPPRYLVMVGDPIKAIRLFNKIAKCNMKPALTSEEIAIIYNQPVRTHFSLREATGRLLSAYYRPRLLWVLLLWFITGYQMAACMASFPENLEPFTSNSLMPLEIAALANSFVIPLPTVEMPSVGRKGTIQGFVVVQAAFCFCAILMDDEFAFALAVIFYMVSLTLSYRVLFPYTLELFETSIRCYGFGLCFAVMRLAAVMSRLQTVKMHENSVVILLVFNVLGYIALQKIQFETAGQPLLDYTGKGQG